MASHLSPGKLISEFATRKSHAAFPHINKPALVKQLLQRISQPWRIDQARSSLCGPAAFLYCVARSDPGLYAKYIIDLYEKGEAKIKDLEVEPGSDCRRYKVPPGQIAEADWVGLASLRDSENTFSDYESITDEFAGITLPGHIEDWFEEAGFKSVHDNTNLLSNKELSVLLQAHQKRSTGAKVCLFIAANILSGKIKKDSTFKPYHWVVLNSDITIDGKPVAPLIAKGKKVDDDDKIKKKQISFKVYTWGEELRSVSKVTVESFLNNFFGYISAL